MRQKAEIITDNKTRILATRELPRTWQSLELLDDLIASDTCGCCYKVYTDAELEQAMRSNIALCDSCRVDLMVEMQRR